MKWYCLILTLAKPITSVTFVMCIHLSARNICVSQEEFSCRSITKVLRKIFVYHHFTWIPTHIYDDFGLWNHHACSVDQGCQCFSINRCSLVGIASMLYDEWSDLRLLVGAKSFSRLPNVSTGSATHSVFYLIVTGFHFSGVRWPGR